MGCGALMNLREKPRNAIFRQPHTSYAIPPELSSSEVPIKIVSKLFHWNVRTIADVKLSHALAGSARTQFEKNGCLRGKNRGALRDRSTARI